MGITSIILFFIYTYGLGYSATFFLKNSENYFERNFMRIGIGLGFFIILSIILNLIRIPLDWRIFLFLSLIIPVYSLIKKIRLKELKKQKFNLKLTKSNICVFIILVLFLTTFLMYYKGSFSYPYLEDSDPWDHALGAKYVSVEKTAYEPNRNTQILQYIDPYPPGYDILMGVLYQTSDSLIWTLKFFNVLIISLGIIFFYFFVKQFVKNSVKALAATFVLFALPCYLSHFIWAHALVITLFFPAFYCLEMIQYDKKWKYAAALVMAGILVVQPTQAIKFGFLFLSYLFVIFLTEKRLSKHIFLSGFFGLILSLTWWAGKGIEMFSLASQGAKPKGSVFAPNIGTASRAYTIQDFIWAKTANMINNPIGIGIFVSFLVLVSLIFIICRYKYYFKKNNSWIITTLLWFVFIFLGVNSVTFHLPVGLFAFRFWMLLAIPTSILAAEGLWNLKKILKKYNLSTIIIIIFLIGILLTSAYQKYSVNTSIWGAPNTNIQLEFQGRGYGWLKSLPKDSPVFEFSHFYSRIIAYDKFSCEWCQEIIDYRKEVLKKDAEEFHQWLRKNEYQYVTIDFVSVDDYGEEINNKINELVSSNLFEVVHQAEGFIVLKV